MHVDTCSKLRYTTEHSLHSCNKILGDVIALHLASNQLAASYNYTNQLRRHWRAKVYY